MLVMLLIAWLRLSTYGFEVFNLGSGRAVSVNELADLVLRLSGKSGLRSKRVESRRGEIFASVADVSKVERVLGFKPRKHLEEGIKELIEAYSRSRV